MSLLAPRPGLRSEPSLLPLPHQCCALLRLPVGRWLQAVGKGAVAPQEEAMMSRFTHNLGQGRAAATIRWAAQDSTTQSLRMYLQDQLECIFQCSLLAPGNQEAWGLDLGLRFEFPFPSPLVITCNPGANYLKTPRVPSSFYKTGKNNSYFTELS